MNLFNIYLATKHLSRKVLRLETKAAPTRLFNSTRPALLFLLWRFPKTAKVTENGFQFTVLNLKKC